MTIFKRALKITFILIFLFFFYLGTVTYVPCIVYPNAYLQAREIGEKIHAFQSKHKRLPDLTSKIDVAGLQLSAGYGISPDRRNEANEIYIWPDTAKDLTYAVDQQIAVPFDGSWVAYNLSADSTSCGHR